MNTLDLIPMVPNLATPDWPWSVFEGPAESWYQRGWVEIGGQLQDRLATLPLTTDDPRGIL